MKSDGKIIGIDQGMKTVLTLSDGQKTPEVNTVGHSLEFIMTKLSKKKKGSQAFERTQEERKNFINYAINQLDLSSIMKINLEEVININYGRRISRKMKHWTNTLIRDKICRLAEEQKVSVSMQSSTYRSQRCSECGIVRKANRKGKLYTCNTCGLILDADLNAAINHERELPDIPH